jgi:hypothetical protein
MSVWVPLGVAEMFATGDLDAECACGSCDVRWVDRIVRARCWLCGRAPEIVRVLDGGVVPRR